MIKTNLPSCHPEHSEGSPKCDSNLIIKIHWSTILLVTALYSPVTMGQTVSETQQNLQKLEHKIAAVQKSLSQTQTQQKQFQQELASIEQQIKNNEKKLMTLNKQILLKIIDINSIKQKIIATQQQVTQIQTMLMQQLKTRYKQSAHQPIEWLFQNPQKAEFDQLLTYYRYVMHMDQDLLQQLKNTQEDLHKQHADLQHTVESFNRMQVQAQKEQLLLQTNKHRHQALLHTLQQDRNAQENALSEYQRNRNNLARILSRLSSESVIQTRHSMNHMKRKLPNPVDVDMSQIQQLHQGIMLYTPVGAPVHAIYPGKVVFSEWLNGYGRLLIIDHGWGLMTLYANNQALNKRTGDIVNQGEQIAIVGADGISKQPGLYFEVRKHGKAISPLDWLRKTKG